MFNSQQYKVGAMKPEKIYTQINTATYRDTTRQIQKQTQKQNKLFCLITIQQQTGDVLDSF